MTRYLALLRGINVGGRHRVPMADLRATCEAGGYSSVRTFIQSGNVLLATDAPAATLEGDLEALLERRFGFGVPVVVRSLRQLRRVVSEAPQGFGGEPQRFHSDVIFLKAPLTSRRVMEVVTLRDGVDQAWPGPGAVYFARLTERRTESRMNRITGTPEYQQMTIRTWSTTTTLLALLDAGPT